MNKLTARRRRLVRSVVIAVAGVAVAVGLAALVVYVVLPWFGGDAETPERPRITATVDGTSVEVPPFAYCEVNRPDVCDEPGQTVELPVGTDQTLEISVPAAISDAPWILATFYLDLDAGDALDGSEQLFAPGSTTSVSVPDLDDQGRVLAGVEVRLPTGIYDNATEEDTIITHATWSVATR